MPFSSKIVANSFLQWDFEDGIPTITPMKLQKLVYITHGWHLALYDEPLIEERFGAWPYGPVEYSLYHAFKQFGNEPITQYCKTWVGDKEVAYVADGGMFKGVFEVVVKKYGNLDALKLCALAHMDGSPWAKAREAQEAYIQNGLIKEHFISMLKS